VAEARLAVIGTLAKGYDLDYIWKQIDPTLAADPAGYYIKASEGRRAAGPLVGSRRNAA
jgi:hypothetical protein